MGLARVRVSDDGVVVIGVGPAICAGFPSPADDFAEHIDIASVLITNPPATYIWRVEGDSMVDAGIHDGDMVVVDRSVRPRDGDVVIAMIDGERSLKQVARRSGRLTLQFGNRAMPPLELREGADVEIWGVVTWGLRRLRPQGAR